jgi:hypothetical protein
MHQLFQILLFLSPAFSQLIFLHLQPACYHLLSPTCHAELVSASHSSLQITFSIFLVASFLSSFIFYSFLAPNKKEPKKFKARAMAPADGGTGSARFAGPRTKTSQ